MSSKTVLVTGGAGYIGAHTLVELVAAGYRPVVVDDLSRSSKELLVGVEKITGTKLPFYPIDCADKEELAKVFQSHSDISGIIHFAAFKSVMTVKRLPKTRSGKILRGTMRQMADGEAWKMPATIDDPAILTEIGDTMKAYGIAKG